MLKPQALLNNRVFTQILCVIATGLIALSTDTGVSVLYVIPVAIFASTSDRAAAVVFGLACSVLSETLRREADPAGLFPRFMFNALAYAGVSLLIVEVILRRRLATEALAQLREETAARAQGEADLASTFESSPVGFLLISKDGLVRRANRQAASLLHLPEEPQDAVDVRTLIPALRGFLKSGVCAADSPVMLETEAWSVDGQAFLARIWVSHDRRRTGQTISIAIADVTDDVRAAEASGLQDLLAGSRVMLGALSHEIRNIASAVAMTARQACRMDAASVRPELEALATLASGLERLASGQLRSVDPRAESRTDLRRVLQDVAIITGPDFRSMEATLDIQGATGELWVRGEHHGVLQAVLNLVNNGLREMGARDAGSSYGIEVGRTGEKVRVRLDVVGRIEAPAELFQPFGSRVKGTGLGLYVSRCLLRSFGGDLRYEEGEPPAFVLEFALANAPAPRQKEPAWAHA